MKYILIAAGFAFAFGGPALAAKKKPQRTDVAAGVAKPAERLPTDIRRVAMIVRSMENSLALYRDVMGMKINYDATLPMSGVALPAGEPGTGAAQQQ